MVEHDEAASGEAVLRGMRRKAGVNLSFAIPSQLETLTVRAPNSTRVSRIWFSNFMPQLRTMNPGWTQASCLVWQNHWPLALPQF
jgi:hypothetical protein